MRTRPLLAFAFLLAACRSTEVPSTDGAPPPADAAPPPIADLRSPSTDAGDGAAPGDFCTGPTARVSSRGGLVDPATVTTSRIIMNCCDGVVLRFHVESVVGARPMLMLRQLGGQVPSGDLDLAALPKGVEVQLFADDMPVTATLTGTAHLDVPAGQNDPIRVRACVTVAAPGTPLDGARLYTPDVPVMPWGWNERFTLKLLADRSITAAQAAKQPLANLALAADPLVTVSSLAYYEKASHRARWDVWSTTATLRNRVGTVGTQGVPFVVEADGQRIYLGAFFSLLSSESFAGPVIVMDRLTDEGFTIERSYPVNQGVPDLRGDARIWKALGENGKLAP